MEKQCSRRKFLKKSATVLGALVLSDLVIQGNAKAENILATPSTETMEGSPVPHVTVKLYPGRSEDEKKRLAAGITQVVVSTLNIGEASVSVAIEEVSPSDWPEKVYRPDILENMQNIYKKPGYDPFR